MCHIDLHMHSCFSDDGEYAPEALVEMGRACGLTAMALTDHNVVRGVAAAQRCGEALGIEVIPGIEIDCTHQGVDLHLLGYCIDPTRPEYLVVERDVFDQEQASVAVKVKRLAELGLFVDEAELRGEARGGIVSGELFAECLLRDPKAADNPLLRPYLPGGTRSDMPYVNFYWDYFAQGMPAHVPMVFPRLPDAVALVRSSGGVPILAHPGHTLRGRMHLLAGILAEGIAGLEVFSTYHTPAETAELQETAVGRGLLVTCGSDFHGKNKPGIALGQHGCTQDQGALLRALREQAG